MNPAPAARLTFTEDAAYAHFPTRAVSGVAGPAGQNAASGSAIDITQQAAANAWNVLVGALTSAYAALGLVLGRLGSWVRQGPIMLIGTP